MTRMREKTDPVACKRFEMPDTDEEVEVLLFEVGVMKDHGHHAVCLRSFCRKDHLGG